MKRFGPAPVLIVSEQQSSPALAACDSLRDRIENPVLTALNSDDAIRCIDDWQNEDRPPRVVIVDLDPSGPDPTGLLRRLRGRLSSARIPVVVVGRAGNGEHVKSAYENGASSYINCPPGTENYAHSLADVTRYWCELNRTEPGQFQ